MKIQGWQQYIGGVLSWEYIWEVWGMERRCSGWSIGRKGDSSVK